MTNDVDIPVPADLKGLIETTGASLIKRMRKVVSPVGKRCSWLKDLSDKRLAEVYHRLKMKQSPLYITRLAQSEWGIAKTSNSGSLARSVYKFRDAMFDSDLIAFPNDPGTPRQQKNAMTKQAALNVLGQPGKRVLEKVDWLGTMNWVMNEQVERIAQLRAKEIGLGMPLKMTEQAVSNFGTLFSKVADVCFRLGLWDSKPSEFNLNFKHTLDGIFAKILRNDGVPMLEATSKFVEMAQEEFVSLEMTDDGSYALKDKEGVTINAGNLQNDSEKEGSESGS